MGKLHPRNRAVRPNKLNNGPPRRNVRIFVNPSVCRRNSSALFHCARLGKYQARSSNRSAPQMHEMPSLRMPVLRRVFAHRRNHDPVLQLDLSYSKRTEQLHPAPPRDLLCNFYCAARSKQRRTHADFRGPFFNRHFKIVRHSHRQHRQRAA